jgi:hypothetical protein
MVSAIPFRVSTICILMTLAQNGLDAQEPHAQARRWKKHGGIPSLHAWSHPR